MARAPGTMSGAFDDIPVSFFCPILGEVFTNPVVAPDGWTYERSAITEWLGRHATSPFTRQQMTVDQLRPNLALRNSISEWNAAVQKLASSGRSQVRKVDFADIDFSGFKVRPVRARPLFKCSSS